MNKSVLTIVLFAMLVMAIVSPFSALSLLMMFLLISSFIWVISSLIQTSTREDT